MHIVHRLGVHLAFLLVQCVATALGASPELMTAGHASGTVTGRILNISTGSFLNNARVQVSGTSAETFTDQHGYYRLSNVPAGSLRLTATYTGMAPAGVELVLAARQTFVQDFKLQSARESGAAGAVEMNRFVVVADKEMADSAVALNEQRFARNLKNVLASDEFGNTTEGNIGEFAKFLPGVTVEWRGGDAVWFSMRGVPSTYTNVSFDGNRIASASSSIASRGFELEQISINNVSRIEVSKSPTPDTAANSMGGAFNLVTKSAFERAQPLLTYSVYVNGRDNAPRTLGDRQGPARGPTGSFKPGGGFNWIVPVNPRFGFTIAGLQSNVRAPFYSEAMSWLPDGLNPPAGYTRPSNNDPYMARFRYTDGPKDTTRTSVSGSVDFKPTASGVLTLRHQYGYYDATFINHNLTFDVGQAATSWSPVFTQGTVGRGSVSFAGRQGRKTGGTYLSSAMYRHSGPVWNFELNGAFSQATNTYRDIEKGFFEGATISLSNVTVRFDDIAFRGAPARITVTNPDGSPVDPYKLSSYRMTATRTVIQASADEMHTAGLKVRRGYDIRSGSLEAMVGAGAERNIRDIRFPVRASWSYLGPDRIANNTDNGAGAFVHQLYSLRPQRLGQPLTQWPNRWAIYDYYRANPTQFVFNEVEAWQNLVADSKRITETISHAFVRGDLKLLRNRLVVVGGVRFEKTVDEGLGALVDPNLAYQRDNAGILRRDAAGRPMPLTTIPLEVAKLTRIERGSRVERSYDGYYPSLNASYNLTQNLLLRAAYAKTLGRPDYSNIIPGLTVPDASTASQTLTLNNSALNPWTANNYDLALEYYFTGNGFITVGLFRKDLSNFFGAITTPVTPEFLNLYNLDPIEYQGYLLATQVNAGAGRLTGFEISYRQALGFLPKWARGIQVFANYTKQKIAGGPEADFSELVPETINSGISLTRGKFLIKVSSNLRGDRVPTLITAATAPPNTYSRALREHKVDITSEYMLRKYLSVYAAVSNVLGDANRNQRYASTTPDYARPVTVAGYYGRLVTIGIKGRF
ncbi:MAG: TonB-dependent receptor [Opitutus sp.]|nr:TonB-dependent receptor [Opitutus sp.]